MDARVSLLLTFLSSSHISGAGVENNGTEPKYSTDFRKCKFQIRSISNKC